MIIKNRSSNKFDQLYFYVLNTKFFNFSLEFFMNAQVFVWLNYFSSVNLRHCTKLIFKSLKSQFIFKFQFFIFFRVNISWIIFYKWIKYANFLLKKIFETNFRTLSITRSMSKFSQHMYRWWLYGCSLDLILKNNLNTIIKANLF